MVVNRDGKLWGENTDGKGFLLSLKNEKAEVKDKKIVILGAGGAAKAISVECALAGAKQITVVNRSPERGQDLVKLISEKTGAESRYVSWDRTFEVPSETDILINGTSIGLYPDVNSKPDINYDTVTSSMAVCDVVFNDPNTLFLQEAAKRGAHTINGLGMLVNQGAMNFSLWTGREAPVAVMENALKKEFGL